MKLLEQLKQQLEETKRRQEERERKVFEEQSMELDDCYISRHSDRLAIELLETKIAILENGGLWTFEELAYLDGTLVPNAKLCKTRYGKKYRIEKEDGSVEWVDPYVKPKTLARKGYKLVEVERPAWACYDGSGRGLAGLHSVYVKIFRSDRNYAELDTEDR